jgi:hypothetical protein
MIRVRFNLAALALLAGITPALAESRLEARYAVSLTGIPIGQGALVIELNDEGYSAAGSAAVTGLLKLVSPGKGSAAARGNIIGGKVMPATYSVTSESGERWEDVRMSLAGGIVREFTVLPPPKPSSGRIPVTEEHRKGVVDPMSAALMPVAGGGDLLAAEACNRTLSIFDGRYRYDLLMSYHGTEPAKEIKGYSGPLVICRVIYEPVAGHRASRMQAKATAESQKIFAWLAPIAGTRVLVPARVTVDTTIGKLIVQATQFSSEPRTKPAATK